MYFTYEQPDVDASDPAEVRRVIEEAYLNGRESASAGTVADYIPELAKASADEFGLCVRSTAEDLLKAGFKVSVLKDCIAYVEAEGHKKALEEMASEGIRLL